MGLKGIVRLSIQGLRGSRFRVRGSERTNRLEVWGLGCRGLRGIWGL